jgi:hypothetical protein
MLEMRLLGGKVEIKSVLISSLELDPNNARKHSKDNLDAICNSLSKFGQRKPVVVHNGVVIAGNGTVTAARTLGWSEIVITEVPSFWDADTAKAFAIADNRTAELAEWDKEVLASQLLELENSDWDLTDIGFESDYTPREVSDMSMYTKKTDIPHYEIVGDKPKLQELFDDTKASQLKMEIVDAKVDTELHDFLMLAADRHVVFNYSKIAEYYAHAPANVQRLLEASALVIIDLDDAIARGYADLMVRLDELESESDE